MSNEATRVFARAVLGNAHAFEWSVQGLGMLRLYLSDAWRLHVWHPRLETPGVSTLHDHPWHFCSHVLSGRVKNRRYAAVTPGQTDEGAATHHAAGLVCGPGGGLDGELGDVRLMLVSQEEIGSGLARRIYCQTQREIHESEPEPGTVTLVRRQFQGDRDHARVFYPLGTEWVTAEPRPATDDEVREVTRFALDHWR